VLLHPGALTRAWLDGRRRPFMHPLQLFLAINVLFFIGVQIGVGTEAFTTDLLFHRTQPLYGAIADRMIQERIGALPEWPPGVSRPGYVASLAEEQRAFREAFNDASPRYANSLLILLVPLFAVCLRALRARALFAVQLVLSLHLLTFLLLALSFVPLALLGLWLTVPGLAAVLDGGPVSEAIFGSLLLFGFGSYIGAALRRVHGDGWPAALVRGVVAVVLLFVAVTIYRGLLFFVVFRAVTFG
jgi:hypothetical protein